MNAIGLIAGRELRALFLSPLAWVILAVASFLIGWLFLAQLDIYLQLQPRLAGMEGAPGVTDLVVAPAFGAAAVVLLLIAPLVTMRTLSEERRSGTLVLLRSAPISSTQIVLGKYLGLLGFFSVLLALVAMLPLSLLFAGSLDMGKLAAGLMGLWLLSAMFVAAGLFVSSLTEHPGVAAIGGFGLLLLLWVIDLAATKGEGGVLAYLSMLTHVQNFLQGILDSVDLIYFGLGILLFLGLAVHRLEAQRLGPMSWGREDA
ncbi:MAG: ABC transporter permease [Gammaproteobacteria bacterium]|nr:ABC transporter permease [Gammaproteobacteria bacterium]MCP5136723.1 ABC transporter permease [Gammaproteobacteria bacterium]